MLNKHAHMPIEHIMDIARRELPIMFYDYRCVKETGVLKKCAHVLNHTKLEDNEISQTIICKTIFAQKISANCKNPPN